MGVVEDFKTELASKAKNHNWLRRRNAFLHQALVVTAALAGCASLVAGLYYKQPEIAGIIAIIPTACTLLVQNLHCIRAQSWHDQMAVKYGGVLQQLSFEIANPTPTDVAAMSKELRAFEAKMTDDWAKVLSSHSANLEKRATRAGI
jgi:hypothetical protein